MEIQLQSFGARLRVKDGLFEVTVPDLSGANHHVTEQFAAHQVRTILLQHGTSVSADALLLALDNDTEILVLDAFGHPVGRFWTNRPSSTIAIWKNQLALSQSPEALQVAKTWVEAKISERLAYLRKLKGYRSADKRLLIETAETGIAEILSRLHTLSTRTPAAAGTLRGLEGSAGRSYLQTLSALLPDEYRFEGRSKRPAADLFNAFLNYGYGILYRLVERALLLAGIHPYIGFLHYDGYQRRSMVFDFIEPFRIWVEKTVFQLFTAKLPSSQHLQSAPGATGGVWLNSEGKQLLTDALHTRLRKKKKTLNGKRFPLETFLLDEARRFSSLLLGQKVTSPAAPALVPA
ncbi:MAG: CRISPR-associated endonuclease Cas1 [Saprospiraceae bacterium]|nr:CRISPR-associated endonuclease Cas1 [Saprospiraceae bacterium]